MKNVKKKKTIFARIATVMLLMTMALLMSFAAVPVTANAAEVPAVEVTAVAENPSFAADGILTLEVPEVPTVQAAMNTPMIMLDVTTTTYSDDTAYNTVINFFIKWLRRIGALVALVGGIMFALAIKNNDAEQKQNGLMTLVAGFVAVAICTGADMFDLFS